ncbi:iron complex outermembrane receptor protein [Altererythrobacter atlanticus]|uniref:Vitamin B12 transporter BtuB n=1 Tax=Croceibacterium atlanticum TaxID=1267766 RepID=A0A0F7KPZ4_9SPHN|nr:TonB-dependent receptor [Croceibacterium atlanticum]AKH42608.1 Vitamin B12 transporter BtuB precursor [Croceibacterium atlanticum]MBB5731385.1 iron complex outermembrane receptor protein [Croceibacterium atlanticum]
MKTRRFSVGKLACGVAFAGIAMGNAAPAMSQDNGADAGDVIVVTGTRIAKVTTYNSADPVTVIDPDLAKREGRFDIAATLQSAPMAAGSTQITSAISSNFVTNGGEGAQTVDLRGLGANRTLVLLNGRRLGPAGTRGAVSSFDLNALPMSIVNNVQVLKTGASSVYGSDAIAGVVNIVTRQDTDGLQLAVNANVPTEAGGEQYRVSAIWGKIFDRGHLTIAGDYAHVNELARGDRSYLSCAEAYTFRPDGSRADLVDPRTGEYMCEGNAWGHVWVFNSSDNLQLDDGTDTSIGGGPVLLQYQYPGQDLGLPAFGAPAFPGDFGAPAGWYPVAYDQQSTAVENLFHPYMEEQTVIPETELYSVYADGAYDITDNAELFGEFLFNRRKTYQNGWRQFWTYGPTGDPFGMGAGNAFNYWGGGFTGLNLLSPTGITDHDDSSQEVEYYRGVAGLRGDFVAAPGWSWQIHGQYSRNIGHYRNERILEDALLTSENQMASCVGAVTPISGRPCIDLPWTDPYFLAGDLTAEQVGFLFDWEDGRTLYTQLAGEFSLNGTVVDLPAGPLALAAGATVRKDRINDRPGDITLAGNAWGSTAAGITAGKSVTSEFFGEISVPVLADMPLAEELVLTGAVRRTSVTAIRASDGARDSDNGNWTYKLGANWAVTPWLRLRASYGTSFRAPALFEQFLADETGFLDQRQVDPCFLWAPNLAFGGISQRVADNCAAAGVPGDYADQSVQVTSVARGGLGQLKAETSTAKVVGFVLTPDLGATRLRLAVDYFDIDVKGEIARRGVRNIVEGCYASDDVPNDPLCSLFSRGQPGAPYAIGEVVNSYVNIARQENRGLDASLLVEQDLGRFGSVSFSSDMTWQIRDNYQLFAGSPLESDNGEVGSPEWVGDFRLNWATPLPGFSLFYGMNVIGGTSSQAEFEANNGGDPCITTPLRGTYCPDLTTPATFYHNLSLTKRFEDRFSVTFGVNNLFDTAPPRISVLNGNTVPMIGPIINASQYPLFGRRLFINATADF